MFLYNSMTCFRRKGGEKVLGDCLLILSGRCSWTQNFLYWKGQRGGSPWLQYLKSPFAMTAKEIIEVVKSECSTFPSGIERGIAATLARWNPLDVISDKKDTGIGLKECFKDMSLSLLMREECISGRKMPVLPAQPGCRFCHRADSCLRSVCLHFKQVLKVFNLRNTNVHKGKDAFVTNGGKPPPPQPALP